MEPIDIRSENRAIKSFRCLPFNSVFYKEAQKSGLNPLTVLRNPSIYSIDQTQWFNSPNSLEEVFRWLIKIGVLRREVDGQGLTSRVRLTPLGRKILTKNPELLNQKAGWLEKISHWVSRKWPT